MFLAKGCTPPTLNNPINKNHMGLNQGSVAAINPCRRVSCRICPSARFGRSLRYVDARHLAGNGIFRIQRSLKPWARRIPLAFPSSSPYLRFLRSSMVRKLDWRKLRTRPKFGCFSFFARIFRFRGYMAD